MSVEVPNSGSRTRSPAPFCSSSWTRLRTSWVDSGRADRAVNVGNRGGRRRPAGATRCGPSLLGPHHPAFSSTPPHTTRSTKKIVLWQPLEHAHATSVGLPVRLLADGYRRPKTPMMIKDILLTLTSFPTPTEARSIENAVAVAQNLRAQVLAISFEMDIQLPIGLYTDPLGVSGIVAADTKKSADNARNLLGIFETAARARGIVHNHSLLRCAPIEISKRLVQEARFRDITMIPLKEGDAAQQDIAELLLFESGRPILVFPDDSRREGPTSVGNVAVAWNNSRPSTRAVIDALPILQQATRVRVFSVIDGKPTEAKGGTELASYLIRHNVDAIAENVKSNGQAIADVFGKYLSEHEIDLLVMGAYGHSRLREFILGGATRSILSHPPTWVLLSH